MPNIIIRDVTINNNPLKILRLFSKDFFILNNGVDIQFYSYCHSDEGGISFHLDSSFHFVTFIRMTEQNWLIIGYIHP